MSSFDATSLKWNFWMKRALKLASLAEGETSPNPLVGAVILDENHDLVGEGFHSKAGAAHAEINALSQAGLKAKGGTLVINLEPCCHRGKTPPCTESILRAGIKKVVVAIKDPDPRVSGNGIQMLREAGLEVICGTLEQDALNLNRAFIFRISKKRPFGILKWAMSFDGRTSLINGQSKWISSKESRDRTHLLRAKCDAVIVGGGTVRADDPLLTSRGLSSREPLRVVLTKSFELPSNAQLWQTSIANTIVAYGGNIFNKKICKLPEGVETKEISPLNPLSLMNFLELKGCNQVLWECGPKLAAEAIKMNCVQELSIFLAPKLLGGMPLGGALGDMSIQSMTNVIPLTSETIESVGSDWLLTSSLAPKD